MSSHLVTPNTEAAILARVIESDQNARTASTNFQQKLGPAHWGRTRHRSLIATCILVGFWQ